MLAFTPVNANTNADADDAARQLANENADVECRTPSVREVSRPPQPESDQQSTNDLMLDQVLAMPELREMQPNPHYGELRDGRPLYDMANAAFTRGTEPNVPCTVHTVRRGFQPSQGERSQRMQNALC